MTPSTLRQRRPVLLAAAMALLIAFAGLVLSVGGPALPAQADDGAVPPGSSATPSTVPEPSPTVTTTMATTTAPTFTAAPTPAVTTTAATEEPAPTLPAETETAVPDGPFTVDSAVLRWGISNELSSAAYNPGTFQLFSAGQLADPGHGGYRIVEGDWKSVAGPVSIEKYVTSQGKYVPATFAGLGTDSDGQRLNLPGTGSYSNHQVVIADGSGVVDRAKQNATIKWRGSFTIVFYSGLSFFYVTDPVLEVVAGTGTVTATVSGFKSSQADSSLWEPLPDRTVVLAELSGIDLGESLGFVSTPHYLKRTVVVPGNVAGNVPPSGQVRTGSSWGAFPKSFVDFSGEVGVGPYFYSSGLAGDSAKVALPLSVSYDAGAPIVAPTPPAPKPVEVPTNTVIAPPPAPTPVPTPTVQPAPTFAAPLVPVVRAPVRVPTTAALPFDAAAITVAQGAKVQPAETSLALVASSHSSTSNAQAWAWWAGSGLLLAAAALLLLGLWPAGVRNLAPSLGSSSTPRE